LAKEVLSVKDVTEAQRDRVENKVNLSVHEETLWAKKSEFFNS